MKSTWSKLLAVGAAVFVTVGSGCLVPEYEDGVKGNSDDPLKRLEALSFALEQGYQVDTSTDYFVPGKGIELKNAKQGLKTDDTLKPSSLFFDFLEPLCQGKECPDGGYKLVGMRYTVPSGGEIPELYGQKFTGPVGSPPVYELYVWTKDNPSGKYAPENPTVQPPTWWPETYKAWKALADKYPTPDSAKAAGFDFATLELPDGRVLECVFNTTGAGAMGYHWLKMNQINTDPASIKTESPAGVIYLQKPDGSWIVAASEWLLWAARQPTPLLHGVFDFDGPMPPHNKGMPEHFDLHGWVGYLNPDGLFTKWNRAATCPYAKY